MEKKDKHIQIRVSERERELLKVEANSRYMKVSEMFLKPFKKLLRRNKHV